MFTEKRASLTKSFWVIGTLSTIVWIAFFVIVAIVGPPLLSGYMELIDSAVELNRSAAQVNRSIK